MPVVVAQNDPIIRNVQVVLDPETPQDRQDAIADYFSVDMDFNAWRDELRGRVPKIFPADVRMMDDQDSFRAALADADAALVESLDFGEAELAAAPKLKLVQKFGIDTRNIDLEACARRGVAVKTIRRRVNGAVAEHAFALMMALAKKICLLDGRMDMESLKKVGFAPRMYDRNHCGASNWGRVGGIANFAGATLGVVGLGEIGREVALRGVAFGMDILYHQRTRLPVEIERAHSATYAGFEELLEKSDYVTIQLPGNPATEKMFDKAAFARMKPGAFLINISRASIIDRHALLEALESGRLGGAGLDVFWEEPCDPADPLLGHRNLVTTPHTAVATRWNGAWDVEEVVNNLAEAMG